jgi:bacteriophage N4 adsorption protein A
LIRILVVFLLVFTASVSAEAMTDYQKFRTYPYIEKAYRLQQKDDVTGAIAEIHKALALVPAQPELLVLLFRYQVEAKDLAAATSILQHIPQSEQQGLYPLLLELQLQKQSLPDLPGLDLLWPVFNAEDQLAIARLVSSRLIALKQEQQAYQWLATKRPLPAEVLKLHAALAESLRLTDQVIRDLSSLNDSQLSEEDKTRLVMALMQTGQADQAFLLIESEPKSEAALMYYRQLLQQQIALQDWTAALTSFDFIETHHQLTPDEKQQKLQWALLQKNWPMAFELAEQLQLNCWQRIDLYMQAGEEHQAKALFLQCPSIDNPDSWLVYAEKWLSADEISQEYLAAEHLQAQQRRLVAQKRLSAGQYQQVLQQLLDDPKQSAQYELVLASAQALPAGPVKMQSMQKLHQYKASTPTLDELSYQYILAGESDKALQILAKALPFDAESQQKSVLPERILELLKQQNPIDTAVLAKTDSWTVLAAERAELWRLTGRCDKTLTMLSGKANTASGWRSLALCQEEQNAEFALLHWQKAHQLQGQDTDVLNIAYLQQKLNDPAAAFSSFTSLDLSVLSDEDKQNTAQLALELDELEKGEQYLLVSSADQAAWYLEAAALKRKQQQNEAALVYLNKIVRTNKEQWVRLHLQKAWIYQAMHNFPAAEQAWRAALAKAPEQAELHAGYGYLLVGMKRNKEALAHLRYAAKQPQYAKDVAIAGQVAYLSAEEQDAEDTLYWLKQSIDRQHQAEKQNALSKTELYRLKRYHQTIAKNWQLTASTALRHGASLTVLGSAAQQAPDLDPVRNEASVRLEHFTDTLNRDQSLYLQVSANGSSEQYYRNFGQEFGAAYKPLQHTNLWLSAALQQYPLGEGDWRALVRLTGDFLNQGKWQSEWQPEQDHWRERKLFVDAVYWPVDGQILLQSKFEQGKVVRYDDSLFQVTRAYLLSQLDYRKQKALDTNLNAEGWQWTTGLGLQSRIGLGETHYDAYRHKLEMNLEWQYQMAGDLSTDQHALSLQLSYQY